MNVTQDNLGEVIAVIKQAIFNAKIDGSSFYPRDIQIISVLSFLQSEHGRLAQIGTGKVNQLS